MPRSSSSFANFLPTAPGVLKEKARKNSGSPTANNLCASQSSPSKVEPLLKDYDSSAVTSKVVGSDASFTGDHRRAQDDQEASRVELVHEVGSASSTSTVSSMFSSKHKASKSAPGSGNYNSTDLTPLTIMDSSPRTNGILSPVKRPASHRFMGPTPASPSEESLDKGGSMTDSENEQHSEPERIRARPGKGIEKGWRITYDPATDRSSKGKDKRQREPQYEAFGKDVSFPGP